MTRTLFSRSLPHSGLSVSAVASPLMIAERFYASGGSTPPRPRDRHRCRRRALGAGIRGRDPEDDVRRDLQSRWPRARYVEAPEALAPAITALSNDEGDIRVRLVGTPFQMKVWHALLDIPFGEVASYAELAARVGQAGAVRAVGTAVGQNPVSWAVPCHRVTRTGGAIGGYHWGEAAKRILLTREGAVLAPRAIAKS
ncbi:methylated-DNA--[protein]-cysteine S-methyltransferase [Paracoccus cavernae]|uniref:Methylated-DNA--[protein]-cysteine S-methyltransferase n=1 Tax=Paracoccus cavernae TaxID=1571207 RepID=A0ABT8D8L9_9RHOB|nr:methylated-DNA--[protein]-cysteine S-methyltransferase [Paracoccus cavernae]